MFKLLIAAVIVVAAVIAAGILGFMDPAWAVAAVMSTLAIGGTVCVITVPTKHRIRPISYVIGQGL
jgi:hypothetical protein